MNKKRNQQGMVYNTQKYKRVIAFPIQGQVWTHRGDLEYRYEVIVVGAFLCMP